MAKSKQARRRARNRAMGSIPYARMRPLTNWEVGSQFVDASGAVMGGYGTPGSAPSWNPSAGGIPYGGFAGGVPGTFQLVTINPTPTGAVTPGIGRKKIDEVKGCFLIAITAATNVTYSVSWGLYVSELTFSTKLWEVMNPAVPEDAARDDWFLLEAETLVSANNGAVVSGGSVYSFPVNLRTPIYLGGGQALHLTITVSGTFNNQSNIYVNPAVRSRIGPVS